MQQAKVSVILVVNIKCFMISGSRGYRNTYEGCGKSKVPDAGKWGDLGSVRERSFAMMLLNGETSTEVRGVLQEVTVVAEIVLASRNSLIESKRSILVS